METRFYLHGTHPHADPMIFDTRYQFYWFDRSGLESSTFLPLNRQFYDLTSSPGACQSSKLFYRSSSSLGNWSETSAIHLNGCGLLVSYFRIMAIVWSHSKCCAWTTTLCDLMARAVHYARCCVWFTIHGRHAWTFLPCSGSGQVAWTT